MVLIALFPSAFLKDDVLWTHQSNVGRVDIAFAGDIQNGCLKVLGNNVRVYEPKWLLDNRHNQGVMVSFPVSYLKKTYKITLQPRGDARKMSLEMNFRGPDLRIHNQRKPAYVCFENIRVNGKTVAEEQTVWHDKPFRYCAESVSNGAPVIISFGIKKPISFTDIRWGNAIGLFVICSLFVLYFGLFRKVVDRVNTKDEVITDNHRNVGMVYRRAFWMIRNASKEKVALLSGLITIALMYLCIVFYYKTYIEVTFTSESDKEIEYQVYYTTEPGQRFSELQSVKRRSSRGKHLERITLPIDKIARFRFDFGVRPGLASVSNMALGGENVQSLNFDDFSFHNIDSKRLEKNKLTIVSKQNDPLIIYQKPLEIIPKQSVDWWMFFLLLCAFGASSYLILSYLRNLKISGASGHRSWIDVVFVCLLGVLLCVPMMHLSEAEKSSWENRKLAVKPHLFIRGGGIDSDYGKKFDAWFNDRFFCRDAMLSFYSWLTLRIAPRMGNKDVLVGKEGWLFLNRKIGPLGYANAVTYSDSELKHGFDYIEKFYRWCQKNNKKFYYVIVPDKNKIYGEYYRAINKINDDSKGYAGQFISYIKQRSDAPVFYLRNCLLQKKSQGLLYYKRDTHWSKLGAYYGYLFLAEQFKKDMDIDFLTISNWKRVKEVPADLSDLYHQAHINDAWYLAPVITQGLQSVILPKYGIESGYVRCENKNGKYRVFVLRDSMFINFLPYFAPNFAMVECHWKQDVTSDDLDRIRKDFDIVLIENGERLTPDVMSRCFPSNENLEGK